jgi:gamma-glutamyltranspeptidase/glutathione hydrolase
MIMSAPGGRLIISAILTTLTNVLDQGLGLQAAIDAPRVHAEGNLFEVHMESRISKDVIEKLRAMGHQIVLMGKDNPSHGESRRVDCPPPLFRANNNECPLELQESSS